MRSHGYEYLICPLPSGNLVYNHDFTKGADLSGLLGSLRARVGVHIGWELGWGVASQYFASADDQSSNIETSQPCFPMGRQSKHNRIGIAARMVVVAPLRQKRSSVQKWQNDITWSARNFFTLLFCIVKHGSGSRDRS
jgi:hypothetical protein